MSRKHRQAARARARGDFPFCDFCSAVSNPTSAAWRFPCRIFTAQSGVHDLAIQYRGDWAACDECRPLVEAEHWDGLADRTFSRDPELYVRAMHGAIARLSRLGPLPPMEVPPEREVEAAREWQDIFWSTAWQAFAAHRRGPAEPLQGGEIFAEPLILRKQR